MKYFVLLIIFLFVYSIGEAQDNFGFQFDSTQVVEIPMNPATGYVFDVDTTLIINLTIAEDPSNGFILSKNGKFMLFVTDRADDDATLVFRHFFAGQAGTWTAQVPTNQHIQLTLSYWNQSHAYDPLLWVDGISVNMSQVGSHWGNFIYNRTSMFVGNTSAGDTPLIGTISELTILGLIFDDQMALDAFNNEPAIYNVKDMQGRYLFGDAPGDSISFLQDRSSNNYGLALFGITAGDIVSIP